MEAKKKQRMNLGLMALMGLVGILAVGTMAASAGGIGNVPGQLGTALGIDDTTAGIVLAGAAVIAVSLAMATAHQPVIPTSITLLATIGMITALGWVAPWLLILAALAFVTMFTKKIADTFTGGGSGAE
jgi:hypothetical protein